MFEEEYDNIVPVEEYWVGEPNLQAGYASQWSDAHSMALHRFGLDWDVYEELVDEEYDHFWESYSEGYDDDFEALYEDDQA